MKFYLDGVYQAVPSRAVSPQANLNMQELGCFVVGMNQDGGICKFNGDTTLRGGLNASITELRFTPNSRFPPRLA